MNDHAATIKQKRIEDMRIAEMERLPAPMKWVVYLVAFAVCCWAVYCHHEADVAAEKAQAQFAIAQQGGIVAAGDDAVMFCTIRKIIGEE